MTTTGEASSEEVLPTPIVPQVVPGIRRVKITEAQYLVVRAMVCDGANFRTAARRIYVNFGTIKSHLQRVYEKTGYHSQVELAVAVWSGRLDLYSPTRPSLRYEIYRMVTPRGIAEMHQHL